MKSSPLVSRSLDGARVDSQSEEIYEILALYDLKDLRESLYKTLKKNLEPYYSRGLHNESTEDDIRNWLSQVMEDKNI